MRVKNLHPAAVAGLASGEVGEVDEGIPAIEMFISAGLLVAVDPGPSVLTHEQAIAAVNELAGHLADAREELARRAVEIADLQSAATSHAAHVAELVAELESARSRIAELVASPRATAAAPAEPDPLPSAEPSPAPSPSPKKGR